MAAVEAESVSVVVQVAVQLEGENAADTPAGNEDAEKDNGRGSPNIRDAETLVVTEKPGKTDGVVDEADSETAEARRAVVNV